MSDINNSSSNRKASGTSMQAGRKKRTDFRPAVLALAVVFLLGIIFYCCGGLSVYHGSAANDAEISEGVSTLEQLSARSPFNLKLSGLRKMAKADIPAFKEEILSHFGDYDYNSENYRRWYSDAAIVGDSVAEAIRGFGWINDANIQSEVGISLFSAEDVIQGTERLQPTTIFMTFSGNDIKGYGANVDVFINDYTEIITRLQNSVPQAEIFIQGILPASYEYMAANDCYLYRDEYREKMAVMCDELGVNYYEADFILEEHPDIFADDGLHPNWQFYPLWLTYMAGIAGINTEE
ncbi:MAG: SGNH/GDSL hydrolase family protein [Parasporobacterium sp.]|nr:SGNH/GDSL hydrolase family protein [Parasporobacterium sp.]